jgi:hypothetical protein
MFNIARIAKPAPGNRSRAFCIGRTCRRTASPKSTHLSKPEECETAPLCRRNFEVSCAYALRGAAMKKLLVAALIAASFISLEARAQNRAGDAALGAVSGAVVLGPVGAVAGAFIGYTAGPSIARSWGVERSASRSRTRRATPSRLRTQESGTQQLATQKLATREQATAKVSSPPPVKSAETFPGTSAAPPVQGFD